MKENFLIRPLLESDLKAADRITRIAFGTFHQLPEPEIYMGDANVLCTRWRANPQWAFAAEMDGHIVGSITCACWGSFGYFGPLTVDPQYWGMGIAKQLIKPVLSLFDQWKVTLSGLFTFGHSSKHLTLYHNLGFRARALTLILEKDLTAGVSDCNDHVCFSQFDDDKKKKALEDCRQLTGTLFAGLDLTHEIQSVFRQNLGDTLLIYEKKRLSGFAICHSGPGTEAGGGSCYVKFAAAAPGPGVPDRFSLLLRVCDAWATQQHAVKLTVGINTERQGSYNMVIDAGFGIVRTGVAMLKPNNAGFNTPQAFVIDDWR